MKRRNFHEGALICTADAHEENQQIAAQIWA